MSNRENGVNLRVPFQEVEFPFHKSTPLKSTTESGEIASLQTEGRITWTPAEHPNGLYLNLDQIHSLLNQLDLKITIELRRAKENDAAKLSVSNVGLDGTAAASKISFADPNQKNKPNEKGNEHYIIFLDYDSAQAKASYNLEQTASLIDKQLKQALVDILWIKHKKKINLEIMQAGAAFTLSFLPVLPFLILDQANNTSTLSNESIQIFLIFYFFGHLVCSFLVEIFFNEEFQDYEKLVDQDDIKGSSDNKYIVAWCDPNSSLRKVMDHKLNSHRAEVNQIYLWLTTLLGYKKDFNINDPFILALSTLSKGLVTIKDLIYLGALKTPYLPVAQTTLVKALVSATTLIEKKPLITVNKE